jgi:transcriptional regulator with PAS, ATPase and Fis domain
MSVNIFTSNINYDSHTASISIYMISQEDEQAILFQELAYFDTFAKDIALPDELESIERERITHALELAEGNRSKAAAALGIGRTLLIHKIKKYDL